MRIELSGNLEADIRVRRYVTKLIGSLEKYAPKAEWQDAAAQVVLDRVDRAHGNKYEAAVTLAFKSRTVSAADSTLNVLAALDIVRLKLANELKK